MRYLALIILLLSLSCSKKIITSSQVSDSTVTTFTPRLMPIPIAGEKVAMKGITIDCDPVTLKAKPMPKKEARGKKAFTSAEIKADGTLDVSGGCDSLTEVITVMDKEIFRLRQEKKTIVVTEYKVSGVDKFCRWFTGVGLMLILGYSFLKLKKFIPWF